MQQWELRARLKALLALQRLRKRFTDLELLREQTLRHFCSQICSRLISPTRELEGYFRSRLAAWLPDEERRAAQGMFGHTTSLLSMLQSLSRYAHTDEQATEPLDLEEVILLAKGACESLWGAPHHEWVVKTQHPLPAVSGRRIDLNMAFCEIFTSALRSMVEGGRIEVQAGATGSAVRVEVKDTGHGIADDLQRSLVELFFPSPGHGARGLGMAVVKDIVERHEGTLSIESSPGVGTSVTVMLPVHKG
ncbi:MAG: ATP-binding protein [Candidatus Riflebacteria bacterium]|nr:ATP-binding protein [Candidatus Riflebacteria bacterium]